MNQVIETDRVLIAALPLPLAQSWRRVLYAESSAARHERAFFCLEAVLKYLSSAAVMSWVSVSSSSPTGQSACGALVKPSLGHWARMLRTCRDELPAGHGVKTWLESIANRNIDSQIPGLNGRTVGSILEDMLAAYRNSVSGHGSGLTSSEVDSRAPALVTLTRNILSMLVGGESPQLIGRVGKQVMRMSGPTASLESAVELDLPDTPLLLRFRERCVALSPLWIFDHEYDDVLVLNKGAGLERVEYLSYGNPRGGSGLVNYREKRAEGAKKLLEIATGQASLDEAGVETLINEMEVSELSNRATGARYGPFRVVRQVQAGGQGILYEAYADDPPRRVALKTLPLQRALSESARRRMKEESAALAKVEHPNVVPIYETGETEGIPWIAMKFVEGKNLDEILQQLRKRSGAVTLAEFRAAVSTETGHTDDSSGTTYTERIITLIRDAARALNACHQKGIVHRDIKPSNLMVDLSGRVILTDFGLARSVDARSQTFTQDLVGTLQYLAPESLMPAGRSGPDARVDVYGLGATLYEGLSLHRPFEEFEHDKAALLHAVQAKEPQPMRRVAPWIPREIETVVMKSIERDRDRRYATAAEFADDLDRYMRGEPVRARPAGPITIARKWVRRNPAKATMAMATLLLLGGLGLWQRAEGRREAQAEKQAGQAYNDISYLDGVFRTTLGLNRSNAETSEVTHGASDVTHLNAEILKDGKDTVDQISERIDLALADPDLRNTSIGTQLEERSVEIAKLQDSMSCLAGFYYYSDLGWFHIGRESDDEAREACESAVKCVRALENREWWNTFGEVHGHLQIAQIEQLQDDVHRQLILLAALRAKPAAVKFTEPPDKYIRAAREALDQADRFKPAAAAAVIDWFCRMRLGETDLPPMPTPQMATDHFILGIAHFWVWQNSESQVSQMVLANAPEHAGLDLKNPGPAAIRHFRIACSMDPQQYWHHFMLGWALSEQGFRLLDSPVNVAASGKPKSGLSNPLSLLTGSSTADGTGLDKALTHLQGAESALNGCITLRSTFPRGFELRGRSLILQALRLRKIDDAANDNTEETKTNAGNTGKGLDALQFVERGMKDFDEARKLAPFDYDVHWSRAHVLELLDQEQETIRTYRTAMQLDRPMGRLTGQQWVGIAYKYLSRITKTAEGQVLAEALGALALANLVQSQTDNLTKAAEFQKEAMDAANRALEITATETSALAVRGTIRLQRGESQTALADFDEILNLEPNHFMAASGRAQALEQVKQFAEAKTAWTYVAEKCAVTDWQIEDARVALERLAE